MSEEKVYSKTVTVSGPAIKKRKLIVWRRTFEMNLKRFTLMNAVEKSLNGNGTANEEDGLDVMVRLGFKKSTYPSLLACTTCENGNVPTEEECFSLFDDDLTEWISAAKELNGIWFPAAEPEEKEVLLEKRELGSDLYVRLMELAMREEHQTILCQSPKRCLLPWTK